MSHADPVTLVINFDRPVSPGDGFYLPEADPRFSCIKRPFSFKPDTDYQRVEFELQKVNSVKEAVQMLRVSASAAFGFGAGSASVSAEELSSSHYSSNVLNYFVRVTVRLAPQV